MPWHIRKYLERQNLLCEQAGEDGAAGGGTPPAVTPEVTPPAADTLTIDELTTKLAQVEQEKADLLKDAMKKKGKVKDLTDTLSQYGDVTPDRLKALIDADNQRISDAAKAEQDRLAAEGNWDALKAQMVEQHQTELTGKDTAFNEMNAQMSTLQAQILELTVGQSFSGSKYLVEETVLPASKARTLYGSHFDVVDGKVVGFDKPQGSAGRTMLVDASGESVGFETAITRIIDADSDRDYIIRSKQKSGAKSASDLGGSPSVTLSASDKITKGLASFGVTK